LLSEVAVSILKTLTETLFPYYSLLLVHIHYSYMALPIFFCLGMHPLERVIFSTFLYFIGSFLQIFSCSKSLLGVTKEFSGCRYRSKLIEASKGF
jgi:hypothetical protein